MNNMEYILKYTLDSTTLKLEKISDISSTSSILTFRKKFSDVKTLRLFTESVSKSTFFPVFNIPYDKNKTLHNVLYCEVAVGDSIFVTKEYAKNINPPDHYASFIVNENDDQVKLLHNENIDVSEYSYVIKDQSRILPLYEITFEYDEELEKKSKGMFLCERCKKNQSISFCPSEKANFCETCDEEVHVDEFHKRHDRYYFNQVGKKRFIYCTIHPETMVDYFCEECLLPICTKCKISGSHSEPPNSSHKLIKYLDACDKLHQSVQRSNKDLESLEQSLSNNIEDFKVKVETYIGKIEDVRTKIENEYKSVMNELKIYENKQVQIINAHYIRAVSSMANLERIQSYPASLEPSQLIKTYNNVLKQRDEIDPDLSINYELKNIDLKGKLSLRDPVNLTLRQGYSPRMDKSTKMYVETRGSVERNCYNEDYF